MRNKDTGGHITVSDRNSIFKGGIIMNDHHTRLPYDNYHSVVWPVD
jgi:hypothetical protein